MILRLTDSIKSRQSICFQRLISFNVVAEDSADDVRGILETCMESAFQDIFTDMPFPVEADICDSWADDCKKQVVQAPVVPISLVTVSDQCIDCPEWAEEPSERINSSRRWLSPISLKFQLLPPFAL